MNTLLRCGLLLSTLLAACMAWAATPADKTAEMPTQSSARSDKIAVGIIAGGVAGTYIRIAADMATVLDTDKLRVFAIIGKGSLQNIDDLLHLKGIDMAIVQSDVLEYLKRQGTYPEIEKRIHYVAKLYNEEFHLIARSDIKTPNDLAGKKVNYDVKGSGTALTASILFDTLKIAVEPTHFDQAIALEKLKNGEISALAYVAGKPTPLFEKIAATDQLHFLSIDHLPVLLQTYLPASLGHQDYPLLIRADQEVQTIAVGAVLAVYRWNRFSTRYRKVADFTAHFFDRFEAFQQSAHHPKWREISLSASIPGWTRFKAAQEWLDKSQ